LFTWEKNNEKIVCLSLCLFGLSTNALATMITDNSGFDGGDSLVTFDEIALANGTIVTNQFQPYGVEFSPSLTIVTWSTFL